MNDTYKVDPIVWFSKREVKYSYKHFVLCSTPLTLESKHWVDNNLRGRYAISSHLTYYNSTAINESIGFISFEDPKEATLYELKWS